MSEEQKGFDIDGLLKERGKEVRKTVDSAFAQEFLGRQENIIRLALRDAEPKPRFLPDVFRVIGMFLSRRALVYASFSGIAVALMLIFIGRGEQLQSSSELAYDNSLLWEEIDEEYTEQEEPLLTYAQFRSGLAEAFADSSLLISFEESEESEEEIGYVPLVIEEYDQIAVEEISDDYEENV